MWFHRRRNGRGFEKGVAMTIRVYSYRYSVYSRIVRMALHLKQLAHETVETDPFTDLTDAHLRRHPFGRVPVLEHDGFTLYETGAITRYLDRRFPEPRLSPEDPVALARMDQVIGIVDSYVYIPLVRQVFSHGVFRPLMGVEADPQTLRDGLEGSRRALSALEALSAEGRVLGGTDMSLAECHLAPMIDYFLRAEPGRALFAEFPALNRWWDGMADHPAMEATDPGLPKASS